MILNASHEVKPLNDVTIGNLVVGRLIGGSENFFAIMTDLQISTDAASPQLVVLTPWVIEGQTMPFLQDDGMTPERVLDLGPGSKIDVDVDSSAPFFKPADERVLVRSGAKFFIRIHDINQILDYATGQLISNFPDQNNLAFWTAFTINVFQPDGNWSKVMRYPHDPNVNPRLPENLKTET